jgi:hypothetical protein
MGSRSIVFPRSMDLGGTSLIVIEHLVWLGLEECDEFNLLRGRY